MERDGSEDVNDFLQRIKELGDKRDQEDEERNRKLEEEILQGRKERQARRAERARSISPTKSSPSTTPTTSRISTTQLNTLSQSNKPTITPRASSESREAEFDDAMSRLTGSPTKENSIPGEERVSMDLDMGRKSPVKDSPSSAMPSRTSTLSWQQRRPNSQSSDRPRQRPLSVIATENAARSPKETPEPSTALEETMSRDQIAQSLASKDPAWFRQTADRGLSSPAYRRNQVEDDNRAEHGSSMRVQMPGMSKEGTQPGKAVEEPAERSSSSARNSRSFGSEPRNSGSISLENTTPLSLTPAQKLDPPGEVKMESRALAMSPSQGRISPERLGRSPSPTKGMGGFVQSAMMKRSDSVNKRWSVKSPPVLNRGNSVASNRSSQDISSIVAADTRSRDSSHEPSSRPSSSHSKSTITQDRPGTDSSIRSTAITYTPDDGFIKPTINAARSRSPTKQSWLESAILKPESPKPKATPPPQQPAWMADLNKKKKESVDLGSPAITPKHEVKLGGLLRSPPPGGANNSPSIGGLPAGFSSVVSSKPLPESRHSPQNSQDSAPVFKLPSNSSQRPKPETPPKKDFRSGLKPRQLPPTSSGTEEPEFKNVFGTLKKTKTQNFVAPDVLKDNITRGKRALTITSGPQKTERKDEFRDAILKKKEDFKTAQIEGKGVVRSVSGGSQDKVVPEALIKRQALGRSGSITTSEKTGPPMPTLSKETSAPGRLQGKEPAGSKLAGRFNPGLADLLARGPPSTASDTSRSSSPAVSHRTASLSTATTNAESSTPGPQLNHITKSRARGPRRKAPSSALASTSTPPVDVESGTLTSEKQDEIRDSRATPSAKKPQPGPKAFLAQESTPKAVDETTAQPPSPRKLDLKRRSQFLQDLPNSNKPEPLSPRPLSPTKKDKGPDTPVKPHQSKTELKTKPDTPIKSPPLKSKPSPKPSPKPTSSFEDPPKPKNTGPVSPPPMQASSAFVSALMKDPPKFPNKLGREQPAVSVTKLATLESPRSPLKESPVSPTKFGRDEPAISVRAAMWSSKSSDVPTPTKSPIKLPTHADEKAALIEAGLRSPSPEKRSAAIGLGIKTSMARPLPTPPTKTIISPPHSASVHSDASSKPLASPTPADTSRLLLDFFGSNGPPPEFFADTATILSTRRNQESNIKTLRSGLYQLSPDGKKQPVPSHQERMLFEGNLYICTHTFGNAVGKKVTEVYYWIGDGVQSLVANEAKIFAQRETRAVGGELVVIKQGKETPEFFSALGGIIIIRRGSSNKYDSLSPHVLCGRTHFGQIAFDEVDFSASSLCSGFCYLISTQSGKCYLWRGKGVHADELSCARLIGMDLGLMGDIEEIEDGKEPETFLKIFGDGTRIPKSADHWRLKPNYSKYRTRLFLADSNAKEQIVELSPFSQTDLDPAKVYILDAFFEIYIITGHRAQSQYAAFHSALTFAQEYGILAAGMEDRPFVPFTTVVIEGVPKDMKSVFRKWSDALAPTVNQAVPLQRGRSLRVVGLNAALEAFRG